MSPVPNISRVVRGAAVNIVLKADQPTGRTVAGVIQDVLTKGNHPRGIKVRLTDGRVGRVKSMATDAQVRGDEPPTPAEPGDFAPRGFRSGGAGSRSGESATWVQSEAPAAEVGLDAYIRPAKRQNRRAGNTGAASGRVQGTKRDSSPAARVGPVETVQVSKCPVCLEFEGDEQAIMHHVGTHFD